MKAIAQFVLNIIAGLLKISRHSVYYLVSGPLKAEVEEVRARIYYFEHIERAIALSKKCKKTDNDIVLDIGGGNSSTAKIFSQHLPNLPIYIFEPIKSSFAIIEASKDRTAHWIPINKAAGSTIGQTEINIANRITASSILTLNDQNPDGYQDVLGFKRKEIIEITTVDHEVDNDSTVAVLKMDVQGYELEVLKGAEITLPRTKIVVLEVNNYQGFINAPTYFELDQYLREHGFELYDMYPAHRENGKLLDWDAIYLNKNFK